MKCATQARDVFLALAQRRHRARHDVQPVEQILAEAPGGDLALEIFVGRRDDAHVDADGLLAADALELLLLQHAQQLELQRRRHVADLVEEQRPLVGQLEAAELALDRARERALLVAEQLRLEQRLGQRAAVDLDERPARAARARVDRARHQLLAGARLAVDIDRRVGGRDLFDGLEHRAHRRRLADDLGEAIGRGGVVAQRRRLGLGPLARAPLAAQLQRALDLEAHHLGRERLLQEIERAHAHRLDRGLDGAERGHDHRRAPGVELVHGLHDVEAAGPVHLQIGDDEVGAVLAKQRQPLGARPGHHRLVAHAPHRGAQPLAHGLVVVDDQNLGHRSVARIPHPRRAERARRGRSLGPLRSRRPG